MTVLSFVIIMYRVYLCIHCIILQTVNTTEPSVLWLKIGIYCTSNNIDDSLCEFFSLEETFKNRGFNSTSAHAIDKVSTAQETLWFLLQGMDILKTSTRPANHIIENG